eukprot:scaffold70524_cov21-Cyclotella_meneghiniana.AAC.1
MLLNHLTVTTIPAKAISLRRCSQRVEHITITWCRQRIKRVCPELTARTIRVLESSLSVKDGASQYSITIQQSTNGRNCVINTNRDELRKMRPRDQQQNMQAQDKQQSTTVDILVRYQLCK